MPVVYWPGGSQSHDRYCLAEASGAGFDVRDLDDDLAGEFCGASDANRIVFQSGTIERISR
jgi:hypothetical protein